LFKGFDVVLLNELHFFKCFVLAEIFNDEWRKWVYIDDEERTFFTGIDTAF